MSFIIKNNRINQQTQKIWLHPVLHEVPGSRLHFSPAEKQNKTKLYKHVLSFHVRPRDGKKKEKKKEAWKYKAERMWWCLLRVC